MGQLRAVSRCGPFGPLIAVLIRVRSPRQARPELADAVLGNPARFAQMMREEMRNRDNLQAEKKRQEDVCTPFSTATCGSALIAPAWPTQLLNADPYDIEAQRKIEEAIRQERVMENMSHAIEYSVRLSLGVRKGECGLIRVRQPEAFGNVCMLCEWGLARGPSGELIGLHFARLT